MSVRLASLVVSCRIRGCCQLKSMTGRDVDLNRLDVSLT
jgi:hypothetical protein